MFRNIRIVRLDKKHIRSNIKPDDGFVRIVVPAKVHLLLRLYASERGIPLQDATLELLEIAFGQVYGEENPGTEK